MRLSRTLQLQTHYSLFLSLNINKKNGFAHLKKEIRCSHFCLCKNSSSLLYFCLSISRSLSYDSSSLPFFSAGSSGGSLWGVTFGDRLLEANSPLCAENLWNSLSPLSEWSLFWEDFLAAKASASILLSSCILSLNFWISFFSRFLPSDWPELPVLRIPWKKVAIKSVN